MDAMDRIMRVCQKRGIKEEVYRGRLHELFDKLDRKVNCRSRCPCASSKALDPKPCCSQWRGVGARLALHEYLLFGQAPRYFHLGAEAEPTG